MKQAIRTTLLTCNSKATLLIAFIFVTFMAMLSPDPQWDPALGANGKGGELSTFWEAAITTASRRH